MKPNLTPEDDQSLRRILRQWTVDTPLPPRFHEQVWRRIARAETQPATTPWDRLSRWIEVLLPRPQCAFSYVAALLVLGIAAGSLAAQVRAKHLDADLGMRYVQSLDPFHAAAAHP